MNSFKGAENPLDFIKNNLKPPVTPEQASAPHEAIAAVEDKRKEETREPDGEETSKDTQPDAKESAPSEQPKDSAADISSTTKGSEEANVEIPVEPNDKDANFKVLRKKYAETAATLKTKEKEAQELAERVKKYETGEEVPEALKAKEARIQELEKYEHIHALKLSPAYKEKYIKPIENIKSKLAEIAADYEYPADIITRALNLTNRRDLNQFLSEHFDEVGASEVKSLVASAQAIQAQAQEAEKEPAKALEAIEADYQNIQAVRRAEANNKIAATTKDAWIDSLIQIRKEGKVKELIPKENDSEYNKTYVEPVMQSASTEYARIVKSLAESGLVDLPKEVAFALARMVQLAHGSAIALEAREKAEREAAELRSSIDRTTRYTRPPIGSSTGSTGGVAESTKSITPGQAADSLINKVMGGRR